jgi:hypothetical protein
VNGRRLTLALAAVVLALPGTAAAATYAAPDNGVATCLRPTGNPGELVSFGRGTEKGVSFDVLAADPSTVTRTADIDVGPTYTCAETASGGGVTVVASAAVSPASRSTGIKIAVREGSGGFTTPVTLADTPEADFGTYAPAVAVGTAGDAVVAWTELRGLVEERDTEFRVVMARRAPGGTFGAPQQVTPWQESGYDGSEIAAGVDGLGTATIAWARPLPGGPRFTQAAVVEVATVAKGAAGGAVQRLTGRLSEQVEISAGVSPDGHALVAWTSLDGISFAERAPANAGFGPATALVDTFEAPARAPEQARPDVSVAGDGAAVVTWATVTGDGSRSGIEAAWRRGGGAFSAAVEVWSAPTYRAPDAALDAFPRPQPEVRAAGSSGGTIHTGGGGSFYFGVDSGEFTYSVYDVEVPRAALSDAGTITLTWTGREPHDDGSRGEAWVATGSVNDAALGTPRKLSGECRSAVGAIPLRASPTTLVAWSDNATSGFIDYHETSIGHGRIHVARPSDARPAATKKAKIDVSAPRGLQTVYFDQPVPISVRCDGPCDLRVWAPERLAATGGALQSGGRTKLKLVGSTESHLAPKGRGGGPVKVKVRACDPVSGTVVDEASVTVRLARHTLPKYVPARDVRTRRSGNKVIVTWRTAGPATRHSFAVVGQTRRDPQSFEDFVDGAGVDGKSKQSFRAVLRGKGIRWVQVTTNQRDRRAPARERVVRVKD